MTAIAVASSATVISLASPSWATPTLSVDTSNGAMLVLTDSGANLYIRIAGPNGYFKELRGTSLAEWNPGPDARDGAYRYDSYSSVKIPQGTMSRSEWSRAMQQNATQTHGGFKVENGVLIPNQISSPTPAQSRNESNNLILNAVTSMLDILIPTANAADVVVESAIPKILFQDTDFPGDPSWQIWDIRSALTGNFLLYDTLGSNFHAVLQIKSAEGDSENGGSIQIGVFAPGDMSLAGGTMYIDKSLNRVGIGTITPTAELNIVASSLPAITIQQTGGTEFRLDTSTSDFAIGSSNNIQFRVLDGATNNSLVVASDSNIGMGTLSPESSLHIKKDDANVLIESTAVAPVAIVLDLEHNGIPAFRLNNTAINNKWAFAAQSDQSFTLSKAGSGATEMKIRANGDVEASGDVYAKGVMLTSSRAAKTDIVPIKATEVMEKLKQVEIAEWRYKTSDNNDRHISPMAEDFYSLFKFGPSEKHINPNDLASVALIAAKELQKKSEVMSAENETLKQQLKEQSDRLASLEKLVTNLAAGNNVLPKNGKELVLNQ